METPITIFWFRRDLRLDDNIGMFEALYKQKNVLPIFIFDSEILSKLKKDDARVTFIHSNLQAMRKTLQKKYNSSIAL
jgi:deoxyribodipyrimidine photo-lyase